MEFFQIHKYTELMKPKTLSTQEIIRNKTFLYFTYQEKQKKL